MFNEQPQNLGEDEAAGLREAVRKGKETLEVCTVVCVWMGGWIE